MHCAAAGDEEDVPDALIGDKLEDIIRKFHHLLS